MALGKLQLGQLSERGARNLKLRNLVISPHVDDAFLALGGLLMNEKQHEQVVLNVFSESNWAPLAGIRDRNARSVTAIRRHEELVNGVHTDARVEFLGYPDCPLRGHYASTSEEPRWDKELALITQLKRRLESVISSAERIYFPLAVGRHVDHILTAFLGFEFLAERKFPISFYEDMPYAAWGMRSRLLTDLQRRDAVDCELLRFSPLSKFRLCEEYQSQFTWRTAVRIIGYAKSLKKLGGFYERVWKPDGSYWPNLEFEKVDSDSSGLPSKICKSR